MHARHRMTDRRSPRRSTESYGLGQSGYTAGRHAFDPALEATIEIRQRRYPRSFDDLAVRDGDDERWTGRGGVPWSPERQE
jgi:hypothetical protein